MRSGKNDVEKVLSDMRKAIDSGKFIPNDRRKNVTTLSRLGILWADAKDEIYDLTYNNYVKGPEIDRDFPNSDKLWFFKKRVQGEMIYIKFKVLYQENGEVKVLSFHIDFMK